MTDTVPVAMLDTREQADAAAEQLRAAGIKCAVVDPPSGATPGVISGGMTDAFSAYRPRFGVVVASEDEERARERLRDTG